MDCGLAHCFIWWVWLLDIRIGLGVGLALIIILLHDIFVTILSLGISLCYFLLGVSTISNMVWLISSPIILGYTLT